MPRTRLHALWTLEGLDADHAGDGDQGVGGRLGGCTSRRDQNLGALAARRRGTPSTASVLKAGAGSHLGGAPAVGGVTWRVAG